jgi:protein-S-isoprenylcysteine O-methyltransferase Ste14
VTTGVYAYIRHPMYTSLLYLAWGVFFKRPSWIAGVLAAGAMVFLILTAKVEEAEDLRYFGEGYRTYMRGTKMFVPFVF